MIPNEPPWIVDIDGIQFATPESVLMLLKAVSEERDELEVNETRLLAVARAAKNAVEDMRPLFLENESLEVVSPAKAKVLAKALAAAEDLLSDTL